MESNSFLFFWVVDENFQEDNFQNKNFQDEILKGISVKNYCSGQYKIYGSFWAHAKSVDLEKHLALDCSNQDKDVIDFYTKVVASQQSYSQAVSQKFIPESTKLTSQYEDNINLALIKAFI
ncbi:30426_t:CDS:2, partial [Gigaspora margarita]